MYQTRDSVNNALYVKAILEQKREKTLPFRKRRKHNLKTTYITLYQEIANFLNALLSVLVLALHT